MAQFSGKVAVVTGSTQGLGLAVASLLAERGRPVSFFAVAIKQKARPMRKTLPRVFQPK